MFNIDNHEISFSCPECGQLIKVTLKQIAAQETVTCRACQKQVNLKDKSGSADKTIKDVNKAINEFKNSLSRLGKK